ncbi:hypothetical protein K466DRAFT_506462, partial [Polyporus arcularius HHB13444]
MLPLELDEQVLDHLQGQVRTLLACALVCKRWHPRCRQLLYRTVYLSNRHRLRLFYRSLSADVALHKFVESVS